MARIRTIKPEFWCHEELSALPEATHMLAAALLNYADDEGYFNANPALIRAACCPLREPSVSVQDSLVSLTRIGFIKIGTGTDGKRYGWVVKFDEHQRVNRPTPSKIKALHHMREPSPTTHPQLTEDSPPEGKGKEGNREQGREREGNVSSLRSDSGNSTDVELPPGKPELTLIPGGQSLDEAPRRARAKSKSAPRPDALVELVLGLYHEILPRCRHIVAVVPKLQKRIHAADKLARSLCERLNWHYVPDVFWRAYFAECADDEWLRGDRANPKNPKWKQHISVLLDEERFAQVMDAAVAAMREEAA